jgi:DNA-binding transcriptional MocR family regulator
VSDARFLYEEVAGFIAGLVDRGTLSPGVRVPSLREVSQSQRVALSTAIQAYRLLEDRGVIEARPKSGYYVSSYRPVGLDKPAISRPPENAMPVAISDTALKLLEYASDPGLIPLGCTVPSAKILATGRLDRLLARAARTKGQQYNTYTAPKGNARLREEIARRAMHRGHALSPEDIIITGGCTEALSLALRAVTKAGDTVAVESPTYFGLLQALEALDLKALELPTDPTTGVDVSALERALSRVDIAACLFASSFNNPLGCTIPDTKKRSILELLTKRGVPLIEDDIYGDIYFGRERPRPFAAFDRYTNVIYCSSFSKTVAPGYRIGWIATAHMADEILKRKFASTLCGPAVLQGAVADFLASGGYEHHLRRMRSVLQSNIERMIRAVERSFPKGTKVTRPSGGFVLWLELSSGVNTRALFDAALQEGICFAPGDVFSTSGQYSNCLRLSCAQPWDLRIERGVKRLGELAGAMIP